MTPQRRLSAVLKELREARGIKQGDLAKRAGVTQGYIAQLESGLKKNPSLPVLHRLAKALKVKVGRLLE